MPTPMFGIISSRLVPFVSGTKASENKNPKDEMMAYVQNVPWRPRLSWRSTNVLTPTNAQTYLKAVVKDDPRPRYSNENIS